MPSVDTKNTVFTFVPPSNQALSRQGLRKARQAAATEAGFTRSKLAPPSPTRTPPAAPVVAAAPVPEATPAPVAFGDVKKALFANLKRLLSAAQGHLATFAGQVRNLFTSLAQAVRLQWTIFRAPANPENRALNKELVEFAKVETAADNAMAGKGNRKRNNAVSPKRVSAGRPADVVAVATPVKIRKFTYAEVLRNPAP